MGIINVGVVFIICIASCIIIFFATKKKKDKLLSRILYLFLPFFAYLAGVNLLLLLFVGVAALSSDRGEGMFLASLVLIMFILGIIPFISALMGLLGRSKRKFDIKMAVANACTLLIPVLVLIYADVFFLYSLLYVAVMFLISLVFSHIKLRREIQNIDEN